MAITEELNAAWLAKDTGAKLFEFRAAAARLKATVAEEIATMQRIAADAGFVADVAAEIKAEGAVILGIANAANTALSHPDRQAFLDWKQPAAQG